MMDLARKSQSESGKTNVAWVIASADALPFPAAAFDYITSTYALRLSNLHRSLPEIRRTIRPGGRVAIRDSVTRAPCFGFWLTYFRCILRLVPQMLRLYGWGGTWRMVAYELSPAGLQHTRKSRTLAPAAFMEIFQRYFPEKESRLIFSPGKLFWENAPQHLDLRNEANGDAPSNA
jgi:ubiquinone/menaquinone biosynthesis C-methylase UbiE